MYSTIITTPIGDMAAIADESAIYSLDFCESEMEYETSDNPLLLRLQTELNEYFEGKRREFDLPLSLIGTPFQASVWETLRRIPYGQTISYKEEARMLGRPSAVRATASANGKNPLSILIPCHRVVASNGGIGGYSGGIWRKEFLLGLEAKHRVDV